MERRTFIRNAGLVATWAGISVILQACSDDDPVAPAASAGGVTGAISTNHGHTVTITASQITAGDAVGLTLAGGSHIHNISLTAQQVGEIGAGARIQVLSSNNSGHSHTVTFN